MDPAQILLVAQNNQSRPILVRFEVVHLTRTNFDKFKICFCKDTKIPFLFGGISKSLISILLLFRLFSSRHGGRTNCPGNYARSLCLSILDFLRCWDLYDFDLLNWFSIALIACRPRNYWICCGWQLIFKAFLFQAGANFGWLVAHSFFELNLFKFHMACTRFLIKLLYNHWRNWKLIWSCNLWN